MPLLSLKVLQIVVHFDYNRFFLLGFPGSQLGLGAVHALHPNQFGLVAAQFGLLVGRCWPAFTEFTEFLAGPYSLGFVFFSLALADSYILKVPFDKEDASGIVYVWVGNSADAEEARITEEIARDMYDAVSHAPCPSFFFLFVASQCFCFVCPFASVWLRGRTGFFFYL